VVEVLLIVLAAVAAVVAAIFGVRIIRAKALERRAQYSESLRKRVEAAPLREIMTTADKRLTEVKAWPTTGDILPHIVLNQLEEYVSGLRRKDIHRGIKVEYRDGKWQRVESQ